jgi:uncharacterized membrane protein YebE (DUF533 family)
MTQTAPQSGETLSTSMYYMWRCVVAIAHADGRVADEERVYLKKVFDGMQRAYGMTAEQRATLEADLSAPQSISGLLPYINDPAARGQLVYFAGLLAHADGVLAPEEDTILKKLHAGQMASLDMEKIRADVKQHVDDEMWKHELAMGQIRPQSGLGAIIDALLLRMGIDIFSG